MSQVIVITSGKGGVGKTTTSANVGTGLAILGKRVVLIDTDIGLRNLDVVMGLENRIGSLEVGKDADIAIFDGHPFSSLSLCRLTMIDGQVCHNTL